MYSLVGMGLLGHVAHGSYITDDTHFCDFPHATLTLFRCTTGEDWNGIMHDAMITPESGRCTVEAGDCGTAAAAPFFISYVVLTSYLVLKMAIALILENYMLALKRDQSQLQPQHAENFLDVWSEYDPNATGLIGVKHLTPLIKKLAPPLGLDPSQYKGGWISMTDVNQYTFQLDLQVHAAPDGSGNQIRFMELLAVLTRDAYEGGDDEREGNGSFSTLSRWSSLGRGSGPKRVSRLWGQVLPPSSSVKGRELCRQLDELSIVGREEPLMIDAAAKEPEAEDGHEAKRATVLASTLRERLAMEIMRRIAIRWKARLDVKRARDSPDPGAPKCAPPLAPVRSRDGVAPGRLWGSGANLAASTASQAGGAEML